MARVKGDRVPPPCAKSGTATLPFFGMTDLSLWHHFLSTFSILPQHPGRRQWPPGSHPQLWCAAQGRGPPLGGAASPHRVGGGGHSRVGRSWLAGWLDRMQFPASSPHRRFFACCTRICMRSERSLARMHDWLAGIFHTIWLAGWPRTPGSPEMADGIWYGARWGLAAPPSGGPRL